MDLIIGKIIFTFLWKCLFFNEKHFETCFELKKWDTFKKVLFPIKINCFKFMLLKKSSHFLNLTPLLTGKQKFNRLSWFGTFKPEHIFGSFLSILKRCRPNNPNILANMNRYFVASEIRVVMLTTFQLSIRLFCSAK